MLFEIRELQLCNVFSSFAGARRWNSLFLADIILLMILGRASCGGTRSTAVSVVGVCTTCTGRATIATGRHWLKERRQELRGYGTHGPLDRRLGIGKDAVKAPFLHVLVRHECNGHEQRWRICLEGNAWKSHGRIIRQWSGRLAVALV